MKTPHTLILTLALGTAASVTSLQASDQDSRIESAAKDSYVFRTYLKHDSVKTSSKDGVVTLTGTVADENHKTLAEDTVYGLPGVVRVDDEIEVKAPHADMYSDTWLEAKVKTALLFHRHVSATATKVQVRAGVVMLSGQADSEAQKDLTTEYARDVAGVKAVQNNMTVVPPAVAITPPPAAPPVAINPPPATPPVEGTYPPNTPPPGRSFGQVIDDASITAEAKLSLATHRSTSALNTKVQTREGVVTVSGVARNPAERDLVTRLVTDIDGVRSVVNNMVVSNVGTTE